MHAAIVLAATAVLAWRAGARDEARDIALSVGVGGLAAGAGVLATLAGPGPIAAETSRDGYLRRAGLDAELVDAYRERFRLRAARYVQWIAVPTAILGTIDAEGSSDDSSVVARRDGRRDPRRLDHGLVPARPDRDVRLRRADRSGARARLGPPATHDPPWITRVAVVLLAGWMVLGALLSWGRQAPFVSEAEARLTETTALMAGVNTPPGVAIVYLVDDDDASATFLGARAANIARAAALPGRAGDVHVVLASATDFFEGRPTERGDPEYDALSRLTLADLSDTLDVVFVLAPFYRGDDATTHPRLTELEPGLFSSRPVPTPAMVAGPERLAWGPSSPRGSPSRRSRSSRS